LVFQTSIQLNYCAASGPQGICQDYSLFGWSQAFKRCKGDIYDCVQVIRMASDGQLMLYCAGWVQ
jgi:hypothetical protein